MDTVYAFVHTPPLALIAELETLIDFFSLQKGFLTKLFELL